MKEQTYEIQIEEVPITVMKRRMKNMYLRIRGEDGRVLISAPHQVGRQRIEQFARERIDWIRNIGKNTKRKAGKGRQSRNRIMQK